MAKTQEEKRRNDSTETPSWEENRSKSEEKHSPKGNSRAVRRDRAGKQCCLRKKRDDEVQ